MLHALKLTRIDDTRTNLLLDDKQIDAESVFTSHEVGSVPYAMITIPVAADIETIAEVGLKMDIDTVQTAISCIQFSMKLDDDLKSGVLYGIDDVLHTDLGEYKPELAEKIMNRVFGLD